MKKNCNIFAVQKLSAHSVPWGRNPMIQFSAVLSETEYQFWPSLFQRLKFLHSNYKAIPGSNPSRGRRSKLSTTTAKVFERVYCTCRRVFINNVYSWLSDEKGDRHFPNKGSLKKKLNDYYDYHLPYVRHDRHRMTEKSIRTIFTILAEKWYRSWCYRWYLTKVCDNDSCRRDHWGIVYKTVATIAELLFVFHFLAIVLLCSDSSVLLKSEFTDFYSNPLNCALAESFYGYTKLVLNKL